MHAQAAVDAFAPMNVSMKTEIARAEIQRLLREIPFRRFVLNMENGDRVPIEHPENIAFQPAINGSHGSEEFIVLVKRFRLYSRFDAISTVVPLDEEEPPFWKITPEEFRSFRQFVSRQIESGTSMSLEQCVQQWREEYERAETIAAVKQGIEDIEAGRVHTLEEVDAHIRQKLGLPPRNPAN
jgi:predicted transcriptional regulator